MANDSQKALPEIPVNDLNDIKDKVKQGQNDLTKLNNVMWGVIAVLGLGFVALLISVVGLVNTYQRENAESYEKYREELRVSNEKIDAFIKSTKAEPTVIQVQVPNHQ